MVADPDLVICSTLRSAGKFHRILIIPIVVRSGNEIATLRLDIDRRIYKVNSDREFGVIGCTRCINIQHKRRSEKHRI